MPSFEYKVVPAPKRGLKSKDAKGTEARFANALMQVMNQMGADGWEYQRADTLPCEERVGLTGRQTTFQHMLVFRRTVAEPVAAPAPQPIPERVAETLVQPMPAPIPVPVVVPDPAPTDPETRQVAAE